uniref:Uncharacterized protein n=1 Tax=Arundo donax TaxID=35708 RepID=A0A0A9BGT8_ARUDO
MRLIVRIRYKDTF